jgi:hypothetical protein
VRDELTGRQALLWTSCREQQLVSVDLPPGHAVRTRLPEGSRVVQQADFLPIYSPVLPGQALLTRAQWYVCPEAGQEGVAEADKVWRVAGDKGHYGERDSFFDLIFHEDVTEAQLASLILGLLGP